MSRGVKRERDAVKRKAAVSARQWQLSDQLRNSVVIAYDLARYCSEPAVQLLRAAGRQRHWPDKSDVELAELVEDVFLAMGVAETVALTDHEEPADAVAMQRAAKYVEEWLVTCWATRQNLDRGVAPPSASMLRQLAAERAAIGCDIARALGTMAESGTRMFLTRLRRRWGGRFGGIRPCEDLPLAEAVSKALRLRMLRKPGFASAGWES